LRRQRRNPRNTLRRWDQSNFPATSERTAEGAVANRHRVALATRPIHRLHGEFSTPACESSGVSSLARSRPCATKGYECARTAKSATVQRPIAYYCWHNHHQSCAAARAGTGADQSAAEGHNINARTRGYQRGETTGRCAIDVNQRRSRSTQNRRCATDNDECHRPAAGKFQDRP